MEVVMSHARIGTRRAGRWGSGRAYCTWLGLFFAVCWFCGAARAVTLVVQGGEVSPGDTPDVCVAMPDNDGTVAGLQLDLVWDSSCLAVDTAFGKEGACVVSPGVQKTLHSNVRSPGSLRILLLSLSDTSTIPAGVTQLFCCQFRVSPAASGRTCAVSLSGAIASDPNGNRLGSLRTVPGAIAVRRPSAEEMGGAAPGAASRPVVVPPVVEGGPASAPAPADVRGSQPAAPAAAPVAPVVPARPPGAAPGQEPVQEAEMPQRQDASGTEEAPVAGEVPAADQSPAARPAASAARSPVADRTPSPEPKQTPSPGSVPTTVAPERTGTVAPKTKVPGTPTLQRTPVTPGPGGSGGQQQQRR